MHFTPRSAIFHHCGTNIISNLEIDIGPIQLTDLTFFIHFCRHSFVCACVFVVLCNFTSCIPMGFPGGSVVKNLLANTWLQSLGREDSLEKELATHSSVLAWEIP